MYIFLYCKDSKQCNTDVNKRTKSYEYLKNIIQKKLYVKAITVDENYI